MWDSKEIIHSSLNGTIYVVRKTAWKTEELTSQLDTENVWTLSPHKNQEGWETDGGEPGYGLYPEVAEYYATCINGYPKVLEQLQRIRELVLNEAPELKSRLDSILNEINE